MLVSLPLTGMMDTSFLLFSISLLKTANGVTSKTQPYKVIPVLGY